MKVLFICCISLFSLCCAAQEEHSIRDLKKGKVPDDSSYVYSLPFEKGKKYLLVQAYRSNLSHKGELALDFKMKKGSRVCAARGGIVLAARSDSKRGGLKPQYLSDGNYIIIRHDDSTLGNYWHLEYDGVLVSPGERIVEGQVIGLSGNTGYTAFPHLHFEVTAGTMAGTHQLPTRFRTKKGTRYLRPLKWYKSI